MIDCAHGSSIPTAVLGVTLVEAMHGVMAGIVPKEIETNFVETSREIESKDPTPCILDRAMVVTLMLGRVGALQVAMLAGMLVA